MQTPGPSRGERSAKFSIAQLVDTQVVESVCRRSLLNSGVPTVQRALHSVSHHCFQQFFESLAILKLSRLL
jgi:hypothetical protein